MFRLLFVGVLFAACSDFTPVSGGYILGEETYTNECFESESREGEEVTISFDEGTDELTLTWDEGLVADCSVDDSTFTCAPLEFTSEAPNSDAVLSSVFLFSGEFEDEALIDPVSLEIVYDCEGEDCAGLAESQGFTIPCTTALTTTAQASE